jgi:hypothetical protein
MSSYLGHITREDALAILYSVNTGFIKAESWLETFGQTNRRFNWLVSRMFFWGKNIFWLIGTVSVQLDGS